MSKFKIGDRVKLKHQDSLLGYISHVNKGQLFELEVPEVKVHRGSGVHVDLSENDVEVYVGE